MVLYLYYNSYLKNLYKSQKDGFKFFTLITRFTCVITEFVSGFWNNFHMKLAFFFSLCGQDFVNELHLNLLKANQIQIGIIDQ